jgi:hypothetical protein
MNQNKPQANERSVWATDSSLLPVFGKGQTWDKISKNLSQS